MTEPRTQRPPQQNLFNRAARDLGQEGSDRWNLEVFARAYGNPDRLGEIGEKGYIRSTADDGAFEYEVVRRLETGVSVLVYLPGNCIAAAANYVRQRLPGTEWTDVGTYPEGGGDIQGIWTTAGSVIDSIRKIFNEGGRRSSAIFHNLDLLCDERGQVPTDCVFRNGLFSLLEAARNGTVLGLADREAGRLGSVERAFADKVTLRQMDYAHFLRIIPTELGTHQVDGDHFLHGRAWQLYMRLRWIDPFRAMKIMALAGESEDFPDVVKEVWDRTRPIGFNPPENIRQSRIKTTGFVPRTMAKLDEQIIQPYQVWLRTEFNSEQAREDALRMLPRGVVLHGPPGTGKTNLARWIAASVGLPFRVVSAAEIKAVGYGDAEKNIQLLFRDARQAAPACLVLDDADDLLPRRDRRTGAGGGSGADIGIVNTTLQELQGFEGALEGVLVIMTTNRFREMDPAAVARLGLDLRVPYPLNSRQVGEIVDAVAEDYCLVLPGEVRDSLVDHFRGFVIVLPGQPVRPDSEDAIRRADANLYSPREIDEAVRRLRPPRTAPGQSYHVTEEDVEKLKGDAKDRVGDFGPVDPKNQA